MIVALLARLLPERRLPGKALVLLLSVAAIAMGSYALWRETGTLQGQKLSDRAIIAAAAAGTMQPGLSIGSQQQYLLECRSAMMSLTARLSPSSVRLSILGNCRAGAEALARSAPTFSDAWLTASIAAAGLSDMEAATRYLKECYRTGRNEQWIAEIRVDFLESDLRQIPTELAADHDGDIALLLSNDGGKHFLAARYVTNAELRARIDRLLAGLPEASRRRFENIVSRLITERQRNHGA